MTGVQPGPRTMSRQSSATSKVERFVTLKGGSNGTSQDNSSLTSKDERCATVTSQDEGSVTPHRKRSWTRSTLLPAKWNSEGGNEENEGFEGDGLGAGKKKRMRRGRQVSGEAEETEKDERLVGAGKALNQTQVFSVERT